MTALRLGVVGCGAVTELSHLPAAAKMEEVQVTLLVDKNLSRAEDLARQYNVPHVTDDYTEVCDKADAAIVALPHYLHAPVSVDLLNHGIHVLVEKPMALTVEECDRMINAARQSSAILAVGLVRRFYAASRFVKQMIDENWLGPVRAFDVREGAEYNWPVASDFFFRKDKAGGGVLVDTGAHTLDMLLWWLGDWIEVAYYDDARGGVEANCELHLTMESGASGVVELSRTRDLRNTYHLVGERGSVEIGVGLAPSIDLQLQDQGLSVEAKALTTGAPQEQFLDVVQQQLADFVTAICDGRAPFIPGEEGRRSVALFEQCYRVRQVLDLPWLQPKPAVSALENA